MQLQAGVVETAVMVNMGMLVIKEIWAQWLTALYDKLCTERSIIINGFKETGIVQKATPVK